ncbi:MAG: molybdopterin-dependent oxidoreductase [Ktedonobacteraceae bacterium]
MKKIFFTRRQRFGNGFVAGLGAGIIATVLMLLLSVTFNGISLPEVFGSALTQLMSPATFDTLHRLIGGDAKHYFFYCIIVGQCLVFALGGGLCTLFVGMLKAEKIGQEMLHWKASLGLSVLLLLVTGLVLLPITGAGFFGAALVIGAVNTTVSLAVMGIVFGGSFVLLQNQLLSRQVHLLNAPRREREKAVARRGIVIRGIQLVGLGALGVLAWRFITGAQTLTGGGGAATDTTTAPKLFQGFQKKIVPVPTPNYGDIQQVPMLSKEITSNDQYYIVSKNLFSDPVVNADTWHLSVSGEIEHPFSLNYKDLLTLPTKRQNESMMCISNEVGGQYMSSALWEGIPLADLLARGGAIKPGATKVVLYAADDYSDSIHLSKALEPTTLLALRMNGATLPQGHGFPLRLLVPGIYGMKHVKWINRIEVVNTDFQGYWQQRGWSDPAPLRMTSRIDTPLTGTTVRASQPTYIAGVAFSGNKGISQVDLSFDGGQTWNKATLKRPLSDLTWVLWELPWQPNVGSYTVIVRAIDMQGNVQDPSIAPPLPDGSSGYHNINVTVQ